MTGRRIAVVGAGWSGLAAAVQARADGHQVAVFEMAHEPGGRARCATRSADGLALDNGQHILIGAYTECLRLMRLVGVQPEVTLERRPLALCFPDGGGLSLPPGHAVIAFVRGVLAARQWPLRARLALLARAGAWGVAGFRCDAALTVSQLAATLPGRIREDLIDPLCVAALNTPATQASAQVMLRVLRDALFAGPGASDLLLPRTDLSLLWPRPAQQWLQARGTPVQLGRRIVDLQRAGHGWQMAGQDFDAVILAASAAESARLAQPHNPAWAAGAQSFRYEPIVTVVARSPGARLPHPMLALREGPAAPAQFVFDLGQLRAADQADGVMAFVVSAASGWLNQGLHAVTSAVLAQAGQQLSAHLPQQLTPLRTLSEKRATFACTPRLWRAPMSVAPDLHAAGDHVEGPYPATLEGAVRSGVRAARAAARPHAP